MNCKILKSFWHKGYVFLFSIVETYGFWSTHKCEQKLSHREYIQVFQEDHNTQIAGMYLAEVEREAREIKREGVLVDDQIEASKQRLNSL